MNKCYFNLLLLLVFSFFISPLLYAKEFLSPAELEKWFNSDDELPTSKVNDGQLNFLRNKPKENIIIPEILFTQVRFPLINFSRNTPVELLKISHQIPEPLKTPRTR